jgi:hypothetical protein
MCKILLRHLSAYLQQTLPRQRKYQGQKRQLPDIRFNFRVEQIMPIAIKLEAGGEKGGKGADEKFWWSPRQCRESQRFMNSQKILNASFPSFRRKPESRAFKQLYSLWTPAFAGVTNFCECIKDCFERF